jgi:hypothetical protein
MTLPAVKLDDKYTLESGRVFLTGTQALVRLPMMQRQRDVAAGSIRAASFRVIADRRSVGSIRRCGKRRSFSHPTISSSSPA